VQAGVIGAPQRAISLKLETALPEDQPIMATSRQARGEQLALLRLPDGLLVHIFSHLEQRDRWAG